jgi:hypothetical protein
VSDANSRLPYRPVYTLKELTSDYGPSQ